MANRNKKLPPVPGPDEVKEKLREMEERVREAGNYYHEGNFDAVIDQLSMLADDARALAEVL